MRCEPASTAHARRRWSPTTSDGSTSAVACANSSGVHQPLYAHGIAPAEVIAQKATTHSHRLAAKIATRSPFRTVGLLQGGRQAVDHLEVCAVVDADVALDEVRPLGNVRVASSNSRSDRGRCLNTGRVVPRTSS